MAYTRYVALGDSQTEGLWDGDDDAGLRGSQTGWRPGSTICIPVCSTRTWPYAAAPPETS